MIGFAAKTRRREEQHLFAGLSSRRLRLARRWGCSKTYLHIPLRLRVFAAEPYVTRKTIVFAAKTQSREERHLFGRLLNRSSRLCRPDVGSTPQSQSPLRLRVFAAKPYNPRKTIVFAAKTQRREEQHLFGCRLNRRMCLSPRDVGSTLRPPIPLCVFASSRLRGKAV